MPDPGNPGSSFPKVTFREPETGRRFVYGFECRSCSPRVLRAIRTVLLRVKESYPRDWSRLRNRLIGFEVTELSDAAARFDTRDDGHTDESHVLPGIVRLNPACAAGRILTATVAHECGHAATTLGEFMARDGVDSQWTTELCANRYVFKWGFSRGWSRVVHRQFGHMGGLPGDIITVSMDGTEHKFMVTKDFRLRHMGGG